MTATQEQSERAFHIEPPDTMSVALDSEFALNLTVLLAKHPIRKVIETGTYVGTGTTAVIANGLAQKIAQGEDVGEIAFLTIEGCKQWVDAARKNLKAAGWAGFSSVLYGLSIPRSLLPTPQEIQRRTLDEKPENVEADHEEIDRVFRYWSETADDEPEDDRLGVALQRFDFRPDLVLLDSAGHMGFEEFEYVIEHLDGPCFIALDDVFHVKHYRSMETMVDDPRFDVRVLGREKFGYCIARYEP